MSLISLVLAGKASIYSTLLVTNTEPSGAQLMAGDKQHWAQAAHDAGAGTPCTLPTAQSRAVWSCREAPTASDIACVRRLSHGRATPTCCPCFETARGSSNEMQAHARRGALCIPPPAYTHKRQTHAEHHRLQYRPAVPPRLPAEVLTRVAAPCGQVSGNAGNLGARACVRKRALCTASASTLSGCHPRRAASAAAQSRLPRGALAWAAPLCLQSWGHKAPWGAGMCAQTRLVHGLFQRALGRHGRSEQHQLRLTSAGSWLPRRATPHGAAAGARARSAAAGCRQQRVHLGAARLRMASRGSRTCMEGRMHLAN